MGNKEFSWARGDRKHDLQNMADEAFESRLIEAKKVQAAAIRRNLIIGHQQTLKGMAETLAGRLRQPGVCEQLIRAALTCGPLTGGNVLLDMIGKCIEDSADTAAMVDLCREDRAGGLNMAAMRAVAPDLLVPA